MIIKVVGEEAYWLALPPQLVKIHPVFHVFMLQKHVWDLSHVIDFDDLYVEEDVSYII